MSFEALLVIALACLGGPLLALTGRFVPVAIGEILAGLIVGRTGLEAVNPSNPTISFLGQVGFAMLMLTVGMHLPLRDPRLSVSLRRGAVLAGIVASRDGDRRGRAGEPRGVHPGRRFAGAPRSHSDAGGGR